jgi:hypothetical protein
MEKNLCLFVKELPNKADNTTISGFTHTMVAHPIDDD